MKNLMVSCGAVCVALTTLAATKTVYVDDDNYDPNSVDDSEAYIAAGFDGTTEAKAFGTIQAAIDASTTKAGDTILVLPGTYDKGGRNLVYGGSTDAGPCRVIATKSNLIIKSRDGAAATHIVGQLADTANGCGDGAMRCFAQYWHTGVHLRGFTLRNGGTAESKTDTDPTRGGAVYSVVAGKDCPTYVVDCVVSNCAAIRGIVQNGTVFRTLFCDNIYTGDGVGRQTQFYSCIFTRNRNGALGVIGRSNGSIVNCTIVGNAAEYATLAASGVYNSILGLSHSSTEIYNTSASKQGGNVTQTANGIYQTIAPALGDFRVIKGAAAETAGDPQYVDAQVFHDRNQSFFPSDELNKDFFGNPIFDNASATVRAGAVNESVAPAGGAMQFNGLSASQIAIVGGLVHCKAGIYAYPTDYPVQWSVKARPVSGRFFAWKTSEVHDGVRFPDRNDDAWLMPPPQTDLVMTNTFSMAEKEVWVDSKEGNDDEGDGTAEKPYQTLQKAGAGANNWYVHCAPGTYDKGGAAYWGIENRICLNWNAVRYVSEGDKTDTTILGRLDENGPVESQQWCGPNAMRLLAAEGSSYVCFTGFTIRDCATDSRAAGASMTEGHQGGVCRAGNYATFTDCLFTNCFGVSSLFTGSRVQRCEIRGCQVAGAGIGGVLASCDLDVTNGDVYWPSGEAYNCTFRGSGVMMAKNVSCIGVGGDRLRESSAAKFEGCIAYGYAFYEEGSSGYIKDDPLFVSVKDGRVMMRSPAFACGVKPTAENLGANLYKYATAGLDGVPLKIADGKPAAGAWQKGVANAVTVKAPSGGMSLADKSTCEIPEGEPLVLTMGSGTRPCFGYTVNGVTNLYDETPSRVITAAEAADCDSLVLEALYAPHWYVNADPEVGKDANTGFTPKTAKRTLEAALSLSVAGDTVHAAKGVYADGSALAKASYAIETRAFLRSHTTLVADEGPEKTFIVGRAATGATDGDDRWGCGEGAVRGVYLSRWTKLSGFTVTGGRTRCIDGQHYTDDNSGGGVLGYSEACIDDCVVENCIVSNNASYRGGGARFVTFRKCRIDGNLGYYNSAMGGECNFYGCTADGNVGGDQTSAYHAIVDCTFGPNNQTSDGSMATVPGVPGLKTSYVSNTLTRCAAHMTNVYTKTYCVATINVGHPMPDGLVKVQADELQLDADLRPIVGANVAVDQAVGPVAPGLDAETDVSGFPRVMNGRRDAGALEGDWRPRYGKDIGARFAVDSATLGVVESDAGKVVIAAGEALSGTWPVHAGKSVPRLMTFTVGVGGSATVTVDGVSTTYAAGTHEQRFNATATNDVRIACTAGSVTVDRFRNEVGMLLLVW